MNAFFRIWTLVGWGLVSPLLATPVALVMMFLALMILPHYRVPHLSAETVIFVVVLSGKFAFIGTFVLLGAALAKYGVGQQRKTRSETLRLSMFLAKSGGILVVSPIATLFMIVASLPQGGFMNATLEFFGPPAILGVVLLVFGGIGRMISPNYDPEGPNRL